jgi:vibriolysin
MRQKSSISFSRSAVCTFAITMALVCHPSFGAQRIVLGQSPALLDLATTQVTAFAQSLTTQRVASPDIGNLIAPPIGLGKNESLSLVRESVAPAGIRHLHYEQFFKNIPVWGERVVASQNVANNRVLRLGGAVIGQIEKDLTDPSPALSAETVLQRAKEATRTPPPGKGIAPMSINPYFSDERTRLVVFVRPSDQVAKLSYEVSFLADLNPEIGQPTRPVLLVDANTGETLYQYDSLTFASGTGPGGNPKTGAYKYGPGQKFLALEVADSGSGKCALSSSTVDTEDLNEGNDAHYFGSVIYNMWKDWYGTTPISQKLVMRVHYGNNFENAFWNGKAMYFGDGMTTFYPLVALDVTSHEIAHGYTEQHSGLIYDKQSGGINEAFSDMAGEAAEFYNNPAAPPDFLVGPTIFKRDGGALRNMCDPAKDGRSIASAKNYIDGLDVHLSSGVYNKAFCLLAHSPGWDARKAFQVFQVANRDYWTPSSSFQSGAEAVRDAAKDLGYPVADVIKSFGAVDIVIQ